MDPKKKLAQIKNRIKEDRRVIAACAITATIAVVYYEHKLKSTLLLTADDREVLKTKDVNMTYSIKGGDYNLRYVGNTPKN